ncbi:MAG: ribosome biogenesis GTPase YlqF [Lachnospiraceae bacterium]|nr:ribosome biogenesis GTPase YlqF [Lachnospiraceae bacterium]
MSENKETIINWYPGHMAKAKRQMQEDMKIIDVVVELVDARIPYSSKNPDIDALAGGKSRVLLLNKADLADPDVTALWKSLYESRGFTVAAIDSRRGNGLKIVENCILEACREKIERDRRRGIVNRPLRAMIVGIPNVGKSTFINSFAGKAVAKTGDKPGVTKGKQWIRLNKTVELLDTPGILWPKFESPEVGRRIAWIGSVNDRILVTTEMAEGLLVFLTERYAGLVGAYYGIDEDTAGCDVPGAELLQRIAVRRGCIRKGGEVDLERAANLVSEDFKSVKIGRVSLEKPSDIPGDVKDRRKS